MSSYYIVYSCEINKKEWQDYTFTSEIQVSVQYTKKNQKSLKQHFSKTEQNKWIIKYKQAKKGINLVNVKAWFWLLRNWMKIPFI